MPNPSPEPAALDRYARLPLGFEPNLGQAGPAAGFIAHTGLATIALSSNEVGLFLAAPGAGARRAGHGTEHRMSLLGASPKAVTGQNRLMGRANYFIGRDPSKWLTAIPRYGTVGYREAWPGIDLSVSGNDGKLEYDFSVVAGADPRVVTL